MIEIRLDGFDGNPRSVMSWEATATGVVVRLIGPLADAINEMIADAKADLLDDVLDDSR